MDTPPASARPLRAPAPPHPPTFGGRVAARLAWLLTTAIGTTLRWKFEDGSALFLPHNTGERAIFAIWHNRQLLAPGVYRRFFGRKGSGRQLAAMASASRDGAIAARILELFDARAVRGSSSRRGAAALTEMIGLAEQGYDLAVTPDGPRGPRYKVQGGSIVLAQYTGRPLVPISINLTRKKVFRSWDGFQIPLPFSRCHVISGPVLRVPRQLDDAGRAELVAELERRLLALTRD